MIRLSTRLGRLETVANYKAIEHHRQLLSIQRKLGLPLPTASDHSEGLRRLQEAIARCRLVESLHEREAILNEFRAWVESEHAKFG